MTCQSCAKINLAGGVRCVYCGTMLPPSLDFDIGETPPAPTPDEELAAAKRPSAQGGGAGAVGLLALLLIKGKGLFALLKFGKIATTLGSMFVFILADARLFGWTLGVGFAVAILVHEMGHVFVNWRKGLPCTAPMLIPFVGAVIFVKRFPDDPTIQAESGAGGPVAGGVAALVCLVIGWLTGSAFWMTLAFLGFAVNLFNLIPYPPLDGSHMMQVLSPKMWSGVLIAMLLWVIKAPSGMLWAILFVGFLFRLGRSDTGRHLLATPAVRLRMAVIYTVLAIGLSMGAQATSHVRAEVAQQRAAARRVAAPASARQGGAAPLPAERAGVPALTAEERRVIGLVLWSAVVGAAAVLWGLYGVLLSVAAGRRVRAASFAPTGWMVGALLALFGASTLVDVPVVAGGHMIGAYFLAAACALVYVGYEAFHRRSRPAKAYAALFGRSFAWAAAGALLVAYAGDDLWVVAGVLLCAAVFYLRHRWMLYSAVASAYQALANDASAQERRRRALALKPDAEAAAALWYDSAASSLRLSQGGPAVEALDRCAEALGAREADARSQPVIASYRLLSARAEALALIGRHEEALACVEGILQSPDERLSQPARILIAHAGLSQIVRARGWFDESQAHIDWCLRAAARSAANLRAFLHCNRSAARTALGDPEGALAEAELAGKLSRELVVEGAIRIARAAALLAQGKADEACREAASALARRPGSLEARYWHGMALRASGQTEEGSRALNELAAEWPAEHWGRLAAAALAPPA